MCAIIILLCAMALWAEQYGLDRNTAFLTGLKHVAYAYPLTLLLIVAMGL